VIARAGRSLLPGSLGGAAWRGAAWRGRLAGCRLAGAAWRGRLAGCRLAGAAWRGADWVRLFRSEGQGLFRRSPAAGTRPGSRPSGSRTPHRPHQPPRPHPPQSPARCRPGAGPAQPPRCSIVVVLTTTMLHRRGSAGLPPGGRTRSGASRAPPAPRPRCSLGKSRTHVAWRGVARRLCGAPVPAWTASVPARTAGLGRSARYVTGTPPQ
jgi:hypothetical protein